MLRIFGTQLWKKEGFKNWEVAYPLQSIFLTNRSPTVPCLASGQRLRKLHTQSPSLKKPLSKALSFPQWTKEGSRSLRPMEAMEHWASSSISWWQSWDCQQSLHIHIFDPKEKRLNESLLGTTVIQTSLTNPRPTWQRQGSGNGEDQVFHGTGPGAVWREIKGLEPPGACPCTASTK